MKLCSRSRNLFVTFNLICHSIRCDIASHKLVTVDPMIVQLWRRQFGPLQDSSLYIVVQLAYFFPFRCDVNRNGSLSICTVVFYIKSRNDLFSRIVSLYKFAEREKDRNFLLHLYTRRSLLDDKITERLFRDVNRRYLTNRCIGAAFLPFLPFSSARIGRRV